MLSCWASNATLFLCNCAIHLVFLQMGIQTWLLGGTVRTIKTGIGFFSSVPAYVNLQNVIVRWSVFTKGTRIWPFPSMRINVLPQESFSSSTIRTVLAYKWLLSSVSKNMPLECLASRSGVCTVRALKDLPFGGGEVLPIPYASSAISPLIGSLPLHL